MDDMLRIKYFEEFKNGFPFVVIISDKEGLIAAYNFLKNRPGGSYLHDNTITKFCEIEPLEQNKLYLNAEECRDIAKHFKNLSEREEPGHAYFDTIALKDIEMLISYKEYDGLF